jgi:hypothetical protein
VTHQSYVYQLDHASSGYYRELEKAAKTICFSGGGRLVGAVFRYRDRDMYMSARILDKLRQSPFRCNGGKVGAITSTLDKFSEIWQTSH